MNLGVSLDAPSKKARSAKKIEMNSLKTYETACALFGVDYEEAEKGGLAELEKLLPNVVAIGREGTGEILEEGGLIVESEGLNKVEIEVVEASAIVV